MKKVLFWTIIASVLTSVTTTLLLKYLGVEGASGIGGGVGGAVAGVVAVSLAPKSENSK